MNELWADTQEVKTKKKMWYTHTVENYSATKKKKEQNSSCYSLDVWNTTAVLVPEKIWAMIKSRPVWALEDLVEMN